MRLEKRVKGVKYRERLEGSSRRESALNWILIRNDFYVSACEGVKSEKAKGEWEVRGQG